MKNYILSALILCVAQIGFCQDKPQIEIKYSKLYATFNFVKQLTNFYPDNPFKESYEKSEFNTEANNLLIAQLDVQNFYESLEFSAYPNGQKIPLVLINVIQKNLISSESISEFKQKTFGVIPSSDLKRFADIIAHFEPIYDALIYQPNKEVFDNKVKELTDFVAKEDFEAYFETGLEFYNTEWDNSVIFEIAVLPSLSKDGFTASAFMNNAESEIPLNFTEYEVLFSVLMHEIFHILYNEEALEFKIQIDNWFTKNPSKNGQYAYLLVNEVLATALGNGYVYEQLKNELDPYDWYNNKYINLMAKKIYPTVKAYIENKKSIDKTFVDTYISIYDEHFSDWLNELDNLFTYRYILSDDPDYDYQFFYANYPRVSSMFMEDQIDLLSIQRMKERAVTKIVIVTNNHSEKLQMLKENYPELEQWKYKAKKEFIYVQDLDDKTKIIIVNSIDSNPNDMLAKKFDNRRID